MKQIQKLLALVLISLMGTSAWALKQNADGAYVIKNAADLYAFAQKVNAGSYDIDAVVTADIDYTAYGTLGDAIIGGTDNATSYAGTFDAQQHKITIATNLDRNTCGRAEGMGGLFGQLAAGSAVKNLWLDGTLTGNGHRMSGLAQIIRGATLQNLLVSVDINSTWAGQDGDLASGGIMGQAEGTNLLQNVVYAGSFKCTGGGKEGNKEWFGGICGWVENGSTTLENVAAIINDLSVDANSLIEGSCGHAPLTRHDQNLTVQKNCYYVLPSGCSIGKQFQDWCLYDHNADCTANASTSTEMTSAQLASGELCYKMNENAGGKTTFTQCIGIDNFVIPFDAHEKVYLTDGEYTNYDGKAYYIDTPAKLNLFAHRVNAGAYDLNAVITADIDYTQYGTDGNGLIGGTSNETAYAGTFDAQGHKITIATNLDRDVCGRAEGMGGLFGQLAAGSAVKNMWLDGTLTGNGHRMSSVAQIIRGATLQNLLVTVDINSTWSGQDGDLASGGIMGQAEGTNLLKNVVYCGSFKCTGGGKEGNKEWFGGICGWVENGATTLENVAAIINDLSVDANSLIEGSCGHAPLTRHDQNLTVQKNCYYVLPAGCSIGKQFVDWCLYDHNADCTANASTSKEMTSNQVKNGELAYALNGSSSEDVAFYQNIGSDKCPVPFSEGHSVVYNNNGTYSNDNADGIYEISSPAQLNIFAQRVNAGETGLCARLTADIDFTAYKDVDIATNGNGYTGTFDGNGHKITIDKTTDQGLFQTMTSGSTVKNLWLDGVLNSSGQRPSGLVHSAYGITVQNVLVTVDINSTYVGNSSDDLAAGGIIGWADGIITLNQVIYKGSINSTAVCPNFGALDGWADGGVIYANNCLTIVEPTFSEDLLRQASNPNPFARVKAHDDRVVATNCYYVNMLPDWITVTTDCSTDNTTGYIPETCKPLTMDQVTSGEACYKLNGDQSEIKFWQLIGEDELPIPYEQENGQVYLKNGVYTNSDADLIRNAADLYAFAQAVNAGDYARNAKVTADIDYTAYGQFGDALIGGTDWTTAYQGTFDAQNHKITIATNLDRSACGRGEGMGGLFGQITNATVKNLWLDGSVTGNGHRMSGLCQNIKGVNIQNVVVTVDINSTWAGQDGDLASGGIMGQAEGNNNLKNVIWAGNFKCTGGGKNGDEEVFGGICGWVENGSTRMDNVAAIIYSLEVDEASLMLTHAALTRHDKNLAVQSNCYFALPDNALFNQFSEDWWCAKGHGSDCTANASTSKKLTLEQVENGELCFLMNGDQNTINFWQTIGEDKVPVVVSKGHKVVYGKGDISCNGTLKGNNTFSNNAPNEMDPHNFVDGVCTVCGSLSSDTKLTLDEDGYYDIADKYQMAKAYELVNNGEKEANFRLIADIDMSGDEYKTSCFSTFGGTFDGQYHTLTINLEAASASVFGALTGTVKNLIVKGKLVNKGACSGVISATPGNCTVENVEVAVEMHSHYDGSNSGVDMGGFFGDVLWVTVNLTNCAFTGHMIQDQQPTEKEPGVPNYYDFRGIAGLIAYIRGNSGGTGAKANIRNCLVAGEAPSYYGTCYIPTGNYAGNTRGFEISGAFVGYENTSGNWGGDGSPQGLVNIQNCYSTYEYAVTEKYYSQDVYGKVVDADAATGGKLCYDLNYGAYENPVWRQIAGEANPVPNPNKDAIVYKTRGVESEENPVAAAYYDVHDVASMATFVNVLVPQEQAYLNDLFAAQVTKDQYQKAIDQISAAQTVEEFRAAYKAMMAAQLDIEAAARNYENYAALAATAAQYLAENELEGDAVDMLRSYLEDADEPCDEFPNGGYLYIMDVKELNNEGILNEKDFLNDLFRKAIGDGYQAGTNISMLLTNADFSNGWNGWDGKAGSGAANLATPIVETWRTTSDSYQTLTGLKPGIYELDMNGATRSAGMDYSRFYSAYLTANDVQVPIMNLQEDPILFSQAQDKVNCYVADDGILNDEAYYPESYTGASYAFGADRYLNRVVVNVGEDGVLKVGFNQKGTGLDNDWLIVANTKLIYRGAMDDASESIALALEGDVARANTILNTEFTVDPSTDVTANFYSAYRTQLQAAVDAAASASSAADQYALIQKLSTLYTQIYECQKAYMYALQQIITYSDKYANALMAGIINQDEYKAYQDKVDEVSAQYQEGSMTTSQANSVRFDEPTAIEDIMSDVESGNTAIYNLAGQKLQKMQKGINIVNGKKIFVK